VLLLLTAKEELALSDNEQDTVSEIGNPELVLAKEGQEGSGRAEDALSSSDPDAALPRSMHHLYRIKMFVTLKSYTSGLSFIVQRLTTRRGSAIVLSPPFPIAPTILT
jgi:hypothetical protein